MAVDGAALGAVGAGSLFLYAAIRGKSVLSVLQSVVRGKPPSAAAAAPGTAAAGTATASGGSAQAALQAAAAAYGWGSGPQWQALQALEMGEGGFNPNATNPRSGAYGLAQALGHGTPQTAGAVTNEYGGYGLSDAEAQAANSGDPAAQAAWMCAYIAVTYGSPASAYQAWQSRSPHWY